MVKKSITISLIAFMAFALAMPLFSAEDCEMFCCQKLTENSCCIQPEVDDCSMGMTSCESPIALLLISGPKPHTNQNEDFTANQLCDVVGINIDAGYLVAASVRNSSASPPISFLTPLRL